MVFCRTCPSIGPLRKRRFRPPLSLVQEVAMDDQNDLAVRRRYKRRPSLRRQRLKGGGPQRALAFRHRRVTNVSSLLIHELPFNRRQSPSKGNFAPRLIASVKREARDQLKQAIGLRFRHWQPPEQGLRYRKIGHRDSKFIEPLQGMLLPHRKNGIARRGQPSPIAETLEALKALVACSQAAAMSGLRIAGSSLIAEDVNHEPRRRSCGWIF